MAFPTAVNSQITDSVTQRGDSTTVSSKWIRRVLLKLSEKDRSKALAELALLQNRAIGHCRSQIDQLEEEVRSMDARYEELAARLEYLDLPPREKGAAADKKRRPDGGASR